MKNASNCVRGELPLQPAALLALVWRDATRHRVSRPQFRSHVFPKFLRHPHRRSQQLLHPLRTRSLHHPRGTVILAAPFSRRTHKRRRQTLQQRCRQRATLPMTLAQLSRRILRMPTSNSPRRSSRPFWRPPMISPPSQIRSTELLPHRFLRKTTPVFPTKPPMALIIVHTARTVKASSPRRTG